MGRIARSWELVKQSFSILRSDKHLMLLPVASAASCLIVTALIALGGLAAVYPQFTAAAAEGASWQPTPVMMWGTLFVVYLLNYFVIVYFNVALVVAATDRLTGGHATVGDALGRAWERKGVILQWAVLAATVGVLLRILEERLSWLGRLVVSLVGIAWTLATYFIAPVLAFENLGPIDALKHSAKVFRETWGEEVMGGFSFAVIFMLLALPGAILWVVAVALWGNAGMIAGSVLLFIYFVVLAAVSSAVHGIFNSALYRYASTREVASGFKLENFSMAWQPK